ncbi:hypothetical protein [Amycolatopsis sp. NPDC051903]|uniref:hypothetical protein n=1 Tax=Amycolatopsis sp. NPDC051903 TaxID=3363936 RepID=UPI003791A96B
MFPAFAFHFRTPHATVVFSGDSTPCENLTNLATGADVLVNEVMAVEAATETFRGTPLYDTMTIQFTSAHTPLNSRPAAGGHPPYPASAPSPAPPAPRRSSSPTSTRATAPSPTTGSAPPSRPATAAPWSSATT